MKESKRFLSLFVSPNEGGGMESIMNNDYRDAFVTCCPYCGSSDMIEAMQSAYGAIYTKSHPLGGCTLYHSVCRKCGTVVRSYVKDPEKLLKRRDRRN